MHNFVVLSILGLVVADVSPEKQGECLVDSGEAVSDAVDASLFMWAATKRCGKVGMMIKCEIDISSAIKATNGMINVILKAVDKCDGLHTHNKKCGLEAGKLTKHAAGLAAAGGEVDQKCVTHKNAQGMKEYASPVMCTIDIKNALKQLFKAIKHIRKSHHDCGKSDKRYCAANAIDVTSSFAAFGGYLAGTIGQCKRTTAVNKGSKVASTRDELCAMASSDLIHHTLEVAESAVQLSQKCEEKEAPPAPDVDEVIIEQQVPRLYEEQQATSSSANLILGAFLPVTAIVGFIGGRGYASRRSHQTREFMSDNE